MTKYLILVKHSLPGIEKSVTAHQWRLSEEGRARAARLAKKLRSFQPEVIVSSIEPKAKETAEIMAGVLGLELYVAEGLHEHDRRDVPFLSPAQFQTSVQNLFQEPDKLVFGNETANEAHARFERAVETALKSHPNRIMVIVAHGTVISLFVSRFIGCSGFQLWSELSLPSFVVVDLESRKLAAKENFV